MKGAIVVGCRTNHGGVIEQGERGWQIAGKAAHLEGMIHYCPKCEKTSMAISSGRSLNIMGRRLILEGDRASCGAVFLTNQVLLKVDVDKATSVENKTRYDEQFILKTSEGEILALMPYTIKCTDGQIIKGITNVEGKTARIYTNRKEKLEILLGDTD